MDDAEIDDVEIQMDQIGVGQRKTFAGQKGSIAAKN